MPVVVTTTSDSADAPNTVVKIQAPSSAIQFTPFVAATTKAAEAEVSNRLSVASINIGSMWAQLQEQRPAQQLPQITNDSFRPFNEGAPQVDNSPRISDRSISSSASNSTLRQVDDSDSKSSAKEHLENEIIANIPRLPSSDTATAAEKGGNIWDGHLDDDLPEKNEPKVVRNLRHIVFSLYRRLFGVVFIVNMSIFIHVLVQGGLPANKIGTIVVGNICAAVLMRQVK